MTHPIYPRATTTREDLEAALRRNLTEVGVPDGYHNSVVDAFLPAADGYAAATVGEFADRRPRPQTMHRADGLRSGYSMCGLRTERLTADKDAVTCRRCWPQAGTS